jgi:PadR family transcriptional regulator PadR
MPNERKQGTYLNGVPELLILRLVAERPMYGYEIVAAIRDATGEELTFGEGIIYPILHGLEDEGLLATRRTTFNGRPRVYYRLTRAGGRKLAQSTGEWMRVAQAVRRVLGAQTPGATE